MWWQYDNWYCIYNLVKNKVAN
ncbi:hypothetical protein ACFOUY_02795 [Pedobacter jamesrossensis]|uniref:Uncharacterized protein n=1 Tax=Pedobacter jamesrossensis TaxID=1908238 RepID=A0ABV8NFA2_9SPHI